jgi:hypothetical protein
MRMYQGVQILNYKRVTKQFREIQRQRVEKTIKEKEEKRDEILMLQQTNNLSN